jgi:hypothetical protein
MNAKLDSISAVHPMLQAYGRLFGSAPRSGFTLITRPAVERAVVKAGASPTLLRGASDLAHPFAGVTAADLDTPAAAGRLLLEVLGGCGAMIVSPWTDDRRPASRTGWVSAEQWLAHRGGAAAPARAPAPASARSVEVRSEPRPAPAVRAPAAPEPTPRAEEETTPPVRQPFGRFLRAKGRITLEQLIDALTWQRQQRPRVGHIAVDKKLITLQDLSDVLQKRTAGEPFLETAVRLGLLTPAQARWVLNQQTVRHRRIGEYFVEQGILSRLELARLLSEHATGA